MELKKGISMKILFTLLTLIFCSFPLYSACKCNCNPTDRSICAGGYDLDRPCRGICAVQSAAPTTVIGPMITACPSVQVPHPLTGVKQWVTICVETPY
jgi:hypothetical protein